MTTEVNPQLLQAASAGDLNGVAEALANGADVNARRQFGDTALNEAAEYGHLEVVQRLVEAGADIENVGGADKTPIMNAAFAGHVAVVRFLLEKGARVNDDLLASVQLKVNILAENAEGGMVNPEAVEAWQRFLDFLITARLKQDLPEIVAGLSAADADERMEALHRLEAAVQRGVDVTAAVPALQRFLTKTGDQEAQDIAAEILKRLEAW
jgi:ankyrin repeat protein